MSALVPSQVEDHPAQHSVAGDDADHDADPLARLSRVVAVVLQNAVARDQTLIRKLGLVLRDSQ